MTKIQNVINEHDYNNGKESEIVKRVDSVVGTGWQLTWAAHGSRGQLTWYWLAAHGSQNSTQLLTRKGESSSEKVSIGWVFGTASVYIKPLVYAPGRERELVFIVLMSRIVRHCTLEPIGALFISSNI